MTPRAAPPTAEEISDFLERHRPRGMTLQRLADEITDELTDELQKIGVDSTRVGLNTVWRWKKGIHAPDAVHAAMLKRVMVRWDRRRS